MGIRVLLLLSLMLCAPLAAQVDKPADPKPEVKPAPKREMSEDAKKLYDDMQRVYGKYYELVLEATKQDKVYDADQVWETAVKEAKNAVYKDRKEFFDAVQNMQKTDRPFKEKSTKLVNDLAEAHSKAVTEWLAGAEKK